MSQPLHIFSAGLWRLRHELEAMSGLTPRRAWLGAGGGGAVGGWGHKPTAAGARAAARRAQIPYLAFEDGFLRSLRPGETQKPSAMVMDRSGIYYDARQPSDLETMLQEGEFQADDLRRAEDFLALLKRKRLSKYNNGRDDARGLPAGPLVLLIDQTRGDASIEGGLADQSSFARMVAAALAENPGSVIAAKLHPEVIGGAKTGYLRELAAARGLHLYTENVNPWSLFELGPKVYTVSSQFGFEAVLAGCEVTCFGVPFYAGWGLTHDRVPTPRRTRKRGPAELVAATYLRYCRYFDAWDRSPIDAFTAVDQLDFLRSSYLRNDRPVIGYRIARWKRRAVSVMLEGPHGPPQFTSSLKHAIGRARKCHGIVASWGARGEAIRQRLEAEGIPAMTIEDGFIRSAGLGAAFAQPLSLVFDGRGIYYNAARPSEIEDLLAEANFGAEELARAQALRLRIAQSRITKYNLAETASPGNLPAAGDIILVPGQVADDAAVRLGACGNMESGNINAALLSAVRRRNPNAFVIFKPHPDVERVGRPGALTADQEQSADRVIRNVSLQVLFDSVGRIETFTSLAGFEALLRGLRVTTHGLPFYAGWGLTEDLCASARRGRLRSLDDLVAAALIRYARYWDPVSGRTCPVEIALTRITQSSARKPTARDHLALVAGRAVVRLRRHWQSLKVR